MERAAEEETLAGKNKSVNIKKWSSRENKASKILTGPAPLQLLNIHCPKRQDNLMGVYRNILGSSCLIKCDY